MKLIHNFHVYIKLFTLKRSRKTGHFTLKRSRFSAETLPLSIYTCIYLYKKTCSWEAQAVDNSMRNNGMLRLSRELREEVYYPMKKPQEKRAGMSKQHQCHFGFLRNKKNGLQCKSILLTTVYRYLLFSLLCLPSLAWADEDPLSKAGTAFYGIFFGTLGTTLCAIIMGATFILAKVGKTSWDKFLYIGFCVAGFIGTPSIIALIKSAVG